MSWRITVQDADRRNSRAGVVLVKDSRPVGMMNMSWDEYANLCRTLIGAARTSTFEVVKATLHERLYKDAMSRFSDPEFAAKKLLEFGWNEEMIEEYANEISRRITKLLADSLPEHIP